MDDSIKNIFIVVLIVAIVIFNIRIDNLNSEIEELEEQKLDLFVEIDELEIELAELEDFAFEFHDDSERLLQTEDYACCIIKNNSHYHRPYYCFSFTTDIKNVFMIDKAKKMGFTPCPVCY